MDRAWLSLPSLSSTSFELVVGAHVHAIGFRRMHVGRAPFNDVVLGDQTVSRKHLAVWRTKEGVFVEDLGSRNGTWVDGRRVAGAVRVEPGATVRLGRGAEVMVQLSADTSLGMLTS